MSSIRLSSLLCATSVLVALACSESSPSTGAPSGGAGGTAAGQGGMSGGISGSAGTSPAAAGTSAGTNSAGTATGGTAGAGGTAPAGGSGGSATGGGGAGGSGGNSSTGVGCTGKTICWDFEEGKIPDGWSKHFDQPNGELLVDNTKPFGTSKFSLHAKDISGGQPQKSIIYNLPANFGPVLWGRMHLFTAGTRPDSHAGFFAAYYLPAGSADTAMNKLDWYEVASYTQNYMSIWHPPWPPGFPEHVQVSDTPLTLDKWTCVEWQFDSKNDADPMQAATPRTWLDGVELKWPMIFAYDDVNMQNPNLPKRAKGTNFTIVETGVTMWQKLDTPNNYWIDDLAVGPERIGCN